MPLDLTRREANLTEDMDTSDCSPARLIRTYAQFATINRVLSHWHLLYRTYLRPELQAGARTILDIGCGGGDVLRLLAHYAERDGLAIEGLGIDPDPRAIDFATTQKNPACLRFQQTSSTSLTSTYDLVISNHVLHHLGDSDIAPFCQESQRLADRLVLHNDIHRSRLAYTLFPLVGLVLTHSYIVSDGLISIRRSFTEPELQAVLPTGWNVARYGAFRLQALWRA